MPNHAVHAGGPVRTGGPEMQLLRTLTWRWLTAVIVGGGLLAGGVWYGYTQSPAARVLAQESPPATATATSTPDATLTTSPDATPAASPMPAARAPAGQGVPKPAAAQAAAKPGQNTNSRRAMGEVVAISQDPGSFTIRTTVGEQQTFQVLQTTVFAAGRDRPYRFELLKVGDSVTVAAGGMGQGAGAKAGGAANAAPPQPAASPVPKPAGAAAKPAGQGQGQGPRAAARAAQANGELIARQVLVRPAGEAARPGAAKKAGKQATGETNGTGQ